MWTGLKIDCLPPFKRQLFYSTSTTNLQIYLLTPPPLRRHRRAEQHKLYSLIWRHVIWHPGLQKAPFQKCQGLSLWSCYFVFDFEVTYTPVSSLTLYILPFLLFTYVLFIILPCLFRSMSSPLSVDRFCSVVPSGSRVSLFHLPDMFLAFLSWFLVLVMVCTFDFAFLVVLLLAFVFSLCILVTCLFVFGFGLFLATRSN